MIDLLPTIRFAAQACILVLMVTGTAGFVCYIYQELIRR